MDLLTDLVDGGDVAQWLDPDPIIRPKHSRRYAVRLLSHALAHGAVTVAVDTVDGRTGTDEVIGVLLSHPCNVSDTRSGTAGPPDLTDPVLPLPQIRRTESVDAALVVWHPVRAHEHLVAIGVRPDRQHHGVGTELLTEHHARIDPDGRAGYVTSADPVARRLCARHGYRETREPIRLTDDTVIWPMWRGPRPTTCRTA